MDPPPWLDVGWDIRGSRERIIPSGRMLRCARIRSTPNCWLRLALQWYSEQLQPLISESPLFNLKPSSFEEPHLVAQNLRLMPSYSTPRTVSFVTLNATRKPPPAKRR